MKAHLPSPRLASLLVLLTLSPQCPTLLAQSSWNLDGNFVAPGQFLGSTNNQPVEFWADGYRIFRVEPDPRGAMAGNIVGGYISNRVEQPDSGGNVIVGGGWSGGINIVRSNSSGVFIGAGSAHQIGPNVNDAVIGGGYSNTVQSFNAFIGSGFENRILENSESASIAGGTLNTITSNSFVAAIGGGYENTCSGSYSTIGGGSQNVISTSSGTIAGGGGNVVSGAYGTVGGGVANRAAGYLATVPGGFGNRADGKFSFAAGWAAWAVHDSSFVWADESPTSAVFPSTAPNQFSIRAFGGARFVTDGAGLAVDGQTALVRNLLPDGPNHSNIVNVVHGSPVNFAADHVYGATIAGGGASHYYGVGPVSNVVKADFGTIGGGALNTISGVGATITGGAANNANAEYSVVGGGQANLSSGNWSVVPGGSQNVASGTSSFAAGHQATAVHDRTFVWAGGATATYPSISANTFNAYAASGASFDYGGQRRDGRGNRWFQVGNLNPGNTVSVWNGARLTDGGIWANACDKHRKTDFKEVDPRDVLERVAALPLRAWRYTNEDAGTKHLGPTAQDFEAAFGLGTDDKSIGTVDADGVALAAIQGLNWKLTEELKRRDAENAELKERLERLERAMDQ